MEPGVDHTLELAVRTALEHLDLRARIRQLVQRDVAVIVAEEIALLAGELEQNGTAPTPRPTPEAPAATNGAVPTPTSGERTCTSCGGPPEKGRTKCPACRHRARRAQASAGGIAASSDAAEHSPGPNPSPPASAPEAPAVRRTEGGRLIANDELLDREHRRALIADTEPVVEVDADGKVWSVRHLPTAYGPEPVTMAP